MMSPHINVMLDKVRETIKKNNLIEKGDTVIVGFSGGSDSGALLLALKLLKEELGIKEIIAAHLNHMIRKEAEEDAAFSEEFAKKISVPFYYKEIDVLKKAKDEKLCTEEAGRNARYDFFFEISKKYDNVKIATAHNLDDRVETYLMRIIRGTGLNGLCSIRYKREDNVIRPLLDVSKEETYDFLKEHNMSYVTDKSNRTLDYQRNKVRNMLIPYLEENFDFKPKVIINSISSLSKDYDFIEKECEKVFRMGAVLKNTFEIKTDKIKSVENTILYRVIAKAYNSLTKEVLNSNLVIRTIELVRNDTGGKRVEYPYDFIGEIFADKFIIRKKGIIKEYSYKLKEGENYIREIGGCILVEKYNKNKSGTAVSDLENLFVRSKIRGDKIYRKNLNGHKKLKDLFSEKKIPLQNRNIYPVITHNDEIIWVPGLAKNESGEKNYIININWSGLNE